MAPRPLRSLAAHVPAPDDEGPRCSQPRRMHAERPRSNTPNAALVLLNDPTFVEAARVFAHKIITEGGDSFEQRIHYAFQHALNRDPDAEEKPSSKSCSKTALLNTMAMKTKPAS